MKLKISANTLVKVSMPYLIGLALLIATFLMLGVDSVDTLSRSQKELWNLGHIAYFFFLLYLIGNLPQFKTLPLRKLVPGLVVFSLAIGGIIELSQYATDRTPDIQDLFRDLTGALLALAFLSRYNKSLKRRHLNSFKIVLVVLVTMQAIPLVKAVADEIIAHRQFPVLASNDTPFERDRWDGNAAIEIVEVEMVNLLELQLSSGVSYPGTSLIYFPDDWSGYDLLVIRLLNPSPESLEVNIRIHDKAHEMSYLFRDRFNLKAQVQPGWSKFEIKLNEIENAPESREMNMRTIRNLGIFMTRLTEPRILYIDRIYLSR